MMFCFPIEIQNESETESFSMSSYGESQDEAKRVLCVSLPATIGGTSRRHGVQIRYLCCDDKLSLFGRETV